MTMLDNPTWTLVDRLRRARLMAGLDQAQLAERLGISRNSVSNYETGKTELGATTFVLWAEVCDAPLEWLAEGVHAKAPAEAGADVRHEGFEPPTF